MQSRRNSGQGSHDVCWGVAEGDGVDFCFGRGGEEGRGEGEDCAAVGGGCFGEDDGDAGWVLGGDGVEGGEFGAWRGHEGWGGEAGYESGLQGDGPEEFGAWVGLGEDWVEDCGEVEDVEGGGVGGGDDGAGGGHVCAAGFAE